MVLRGLQICLISLKMPGCSQVLQALKKVLLKLYVKYENLKTGALKMYNYVIVGSFYIFHEMKNYTIYKRTFYSIRFSRLNLKQE